MNTLVKTLEQGYDFSIKAGESYEKLIDLLYQEKVEWKDISKHIITLYGSKWPSNEKGKPVGVKAAIEQGFKGAQALNRFNAYRSATYSDYGVPKTLPEPKQSEGGESEDAESTKGTGEEKETSGVNKFSPEEIALYLAGMEKMVESEEAKHALRILKDEFGIKQ